MVGASVVPLDGVPTPGFVAAFAGSDGPAAPVDPPPAHLLAGPAEGIGVPPVQVRAPASVVALVVVRLVDAFSSRSDTSGTGTHLVTLVWPRTSAVPLHWLGNDIPCS